MLERLDFTVRFITPAFLGDAEQKGVWRTPPFKALLRQWWRIAAAKSYGYDVASLRRAEGFLFGVAADRENDSRQSQVRLRLKEWRDGTLRQWPNRPSDDPRIAHREVPSPVSAQLYLGYGPLVHRGGTALKSSAAIQANEDNRLMLGIPSAQADCLRNALQLAHWFGSLGSRSRNGWGSLEWDGGQLAGFEALTSNHELLQQLARPLQDCLHLDWPHAIGTDQGRLLIWKTAPQANWRAALCELARIKIAFRTDLSFTSGGPHRNLQDRHILAYPVTRHSLHAWGTQKRLANQLRFKVYRTGNQFVGLIYHLPCAIPQNLLDSLRPTPPQRAQLATQQLTVWRRVHGVLDRQATRL